MELETKAVEHSPNTQYEIKHAFEDFLTGFAAFRQANDERLAGIERRSADVLQEEKVARLDAAMTETKQKLDSLMLAQARPVLGGERKAFDPATAEHKARFDRYVRKGDGPNGVNDMEVKALSEGSNPDGGYTVPLEIERTIDRVLAKASPIRSIAGVRAIGGATYRKPINIVEAASGWVGETGAITQTATPTLAALDFPAMELYAMPAATQMLLDDSQVDIEQWLADEVQIVFAEQEGAAFVNGTGTNQPKGFLQYTAVADASYSWGNIGYIASGAAGAFAATNPSDPLMDLCYAPKQGYRANARWLMNRKTEAAIRKFKDTTGNYIWQPGAAAGQPATVLGYPVTEVEDMPDIAAGSLSIAFGDFARGYLIVDRVGIRVLRDPYSAKPYVLFYTTKRVGGGVQNFEAIKLMKFAAS